MLIDVRPTKRLRGKTPLDLTGALTPIIEVLRADEIELARLRIVCDWVQYKNNFRNAIDVRPILAPEAGHHGNGAGCETSPDIELAVDLRRCDDDTLTETLQAALDAIGKPDAQGRVYLEDWMPATKSKIWEFNSLYWRFLGVWEQATGRRYEQALPGGESAARNSEAARELILEMFTVWDDLAAHNSLPDELYVIELGVGNGNQAKAWLDEFLVCDREHGRDYYDRLHYLMCDYSEHVLALARETVAEHTQRVSSLALDATTPSTALGFLRFKVFLVYISNVYDNLPTQEIARIGGHTYCAETRAYFAEDDAARIAADIGVTPVALPGVVNKLLQLGPELLTQALGQQFSDLAAAAAFWMTVWNAVKLEERYAPIAGLDLYQIAPGVNGEMLRPMLEADGDIRMHVSNGAVASFVDTLPLLHPYGRLQCHDIFVTDPQKYHEAFFGPGKYDGSVVNWVNGALLQHIGRRRGFDVQFQSFAYRTGTNIVTMTVQVRD